MKGVRTQGASSDGRQALAAYAMEGTDLRGRRPDRRHVGSAAVGRTGDLPATPSKRLDGTGFPQQCSFFRICEDFHEERQGPGRPATRESGETPVHGSSDCRNPRTMFGVDSHIREKLQFALGKPRFRPSDGQPQAATVNQTPPSEWSIPDTHRKASGSLPAAMWTLTWSWPAALLAPGVVAVVRASRARAGSRSATPGAPDEVKVP